MDANQWTCTNTHTGPHTHARARIRTHTPQARARQCTRLRHRPRRAVVLTLIVARYGPFAHTPTPSLESHSLGIVLAVAVFRV